MASKTSLNDYIYTQLSTIFSTSTVYLIGAVPTTTPETSCYFKVTTNGDGDRDDIESFNETLEINIYTTTGQNTSTLLSKADSVENLLHNATLNGTDFIFDTILFARDDNIETLDENIKHSQLLFELRYNEF